jgi:hypothetical protein
VIIRDGAESCTVGYLAKNIVKVQGPKYESRFGQITLLYKDCDSKVRREKDHRSLGAASFILLDDIPVNE